MVIHEADPEFKTLSLGKSEQKPFLPMLEQIKENCLQNTVVTSGNGNKASFQHILTSCVTLDRVLYLSEPQFSPL